MRENSKRAAQYGILIALALVLSYLEAQIPPLAAVPGMKLGLTNLVVLFALYMRGYRSALLINVLRILLVSVLFGNGMSFVYSLAGGILSGLVMMLLKRTGKFRIVTVSICGGIAHNIGQILAAMAMLQTTMLAWYLLVLWFTGIVSGLVIGLVGGELVRRIGPMLQGGNKK